MKIKDSQELLVIFPAKDAQAKITAGKIRNNGSDPFDVGLRNALSKLEYLIDIGCYSTKIEIYSGFLVGQPGWDTSDLVLAMPEDPILQKHKEEEMEDF